MRTTLTTDPTPTCGHEDCAPLRNTQTGEWVTYCEWDAPALETAA
jgi:hypothetical protein